MRRRDREISDRAAIEAIIAGAEVCRLGLCDDGRPYVVPMSFGYRDGTVYFHSAASGRKIDILKVNPQVCVEWDVNEGLVRSEVACECSMRYRSVIGFGTVRFLEAPEDKARALDIIMANYSGGTHEYAEASLTATAVFAVELAEVSGKQSGM